MSEEIGNATCVRESDGTVTVRHADPLIRVESEWLGAWQFMEPDGVLRLDTAGEYRYRLAYEESESCSVYRRIEAPSE